MKVAMNPKTKVYGILSILILGIALFFPTISMATSMKGGKLVVQKDGEVWVTFKGSDAAHTSALKYNGKTIFNNKSSAVGTKVSLGKFKAGDVIELKLKNLTTGHSFSAGGSNAKLKGFGNDQLLAAFEDLMGGGDKDFNDLKFILENLGTDNPQGGGSQATQGSDQGNLGTPEPTTVILMGSGLLWLAAWRWKKKGTTTE